jgi:hypothetical protein
LAGPGDIYVFINKDREEIYSTLEKDLQRGAVGWKAE